MSAGRAGWWICGDFRINNHTLRGFRDGHVESLETLLVDSIAAQGLVSLKTVAQDGMRVRTSAGKSSFPRQPTLEELRQRAAAHLQKLKDEDEDESRQAADA